MLRVGISRAYNHAFDSIRLDRISARRSPAMRATRFKRDVKRRTLGIVSTIFRATYRLDFRVRPTCRRCSSAPNNFSTLHQHRAHGRIRRGAAVATLREPQSKPHELNIRHLRHRSDTHPTRQSEKPRASLPIAQKICPALKTTRQVATFALRLSPAAPSSAHETIPVSFLRGWLAHHRGRPLLCFAR